MADIHSDHASPSPPSDGANPDLSEIGDGSVVDACVARLKEWNSKNRSRPYWSLYGVHPSTKNDSDGETLVCLLCHDISEPIPSSRDKKQREGYMHYTSSSGPNPVKRHAERNHAAILQAVTKRYDPVTSAIDRRKKRSRDVQLTVPEQLFKLPKYGDRATTQQTFDRVLGLFISETA